jgi:hypothetical protein
MLSTSRSIMFFTTRTSGTNSSWRILAMFNKHAKLQGLPERERITMATEVEKGNIPAGFDWSGFPAEGFITLHQLIERINPAPLAPATGPLFLVNFRDPRDIACNQFYWQDGHRRPDESDEEFAERIEGVHEMGIDKWVVSRLPKNPDDPNEYTRKFLDQVDMIPLGDRVMLGYARLCVGFDDWVARVARVFGVELTEKLKQELEPERVDNLDTNKRWVGHTWVGSDTQPGRYKHDVSPETIAKMNIAYAPSLRRMAALDPAYSDLYLEGLPG